jgi:hypothetical protein
VDVGPPRRAVLAAVATAVPLLVTGCRGIQVLGSPPGPAPDIRLLRSLIAAEEAMVARYRTAIAQAGSATGGGAPAAGQSSQAVAAGLTTILGEHEQHLARLRDRVIEPATYRPSAPGSHAAEVPAGLDGLLATLASYEQAASSKLNAAVLATPPSVAQLLASIAASEATHVPALGALRRQR